MRRIYATARPSSVGLPVIPMDRIDERAWEIARQRHPQLYAWRQVIAEAREPVELTDDPTGAVSFLAERQSGVVPGVAMALAVIAAWAAFFLFLP